MPAEPVTCIACGAQLRPYLARMFDDRYGLPGYFDIFRCDRCRQCQTVPLLRSEDLPQLYGNYYPRRDIDIAALLAQVGTPDDPATVARRRREGTDNQGQYLARRGMKVLDYGCGSGVSLLEAQALGAEAYGIETDPNVQQVIDALGLRIHIGTLDDAPFGDTRFDLIVLNQVIEHLPEPAGLLARLGDLLAPGGRLVLSFPNAGSVFARAFGRTWINWHVPYHLHHFNPRSARLFFSRCGWRVRTMRTITPNLWTQLQCLASCETTVNGRANPLWTGEPRSPDLERMRRPPGWVARRLRQFAVAASAPGPGAVLTVFDRTLDRLGWGDSILAELVPAGALEQR